MFRCGRKPMSWRSACSVSGGKECEPPRHQDTKAFLVSWCLGGKNLLTGIALNSLTFLELYAIVCAAWITLWMAIVTYATLRQRHVRQAPPPPAILPRVSIVLAALNEETTIEPAMR